MVIYVISYAELNETPDKVKVIKDLSDVYVSSSIEQKAEFGTELNERLSRILTDNDVEMVYADTVNKKARQLIPGMINERKPDLLVSYNLAGFEWTTLTDGLGYNLVHCKQFHFVDNDNPENEDRLNLNRAINLFVIDRR